jgi:hypothetical protein
MTSKAERKRRKKAPKISLPGGQSVDQRAPTDPRREKQRDPTETVARARVRQTGILDPKEALQPINGTDMGRCIRHMATGDDRADLVNTWAALSASHRNYRLLVIGQTGDPQGAAIPMISESVETDPSLRVDLRTQDERVTAAKASWRGWEAKMNALPVPSLKWALRGALNGFLGDGCLWANQAPTVTGRVAVQALRMVLDKSA